MPWERCERALYTPKHAVNTMQQLLARCRSVMYTIKAQRENCEDVVYTLLLANLIYLCVYRGDPTARWQVFRTLYKRCGIAVCCDRGFWHICFSSLLQRYVPQQLYIQTKNNTNWLPDKLWNEPQTFYSLKRILDEHAPAL